MIIRAPFVLCAGLLVSCAGILDTHGIAGAQADAGSQDIQEYRVTLEPNSNRTWVKGRQTVIFAPQSVVGGALLFTENNLRIGAARIDGHEAQALVEAGNLRIVLPKAIRRKKSSVLEFSFEGAPARGYTVKDGMVVTGYFACDWMICAQDAFGDKASISLDIVLPRKMETIGPGVLIESGDLPSGEFHALWREKRPYSAYLYAFAVGDFKIAKRVIRDVEFQILSPVDSSAKSERLFAPTAEMLAFFQAKAGVEFPHRTYAQLIVDGSVAQEAVSHSIIGLKTIASLFEDPTDDWAIAHELAHQWWGNSITCRTLSEFWLNEGMTVFMVASWKEHRWGREAYAREMDLARQRLSIAAGAGMDVPLNYSGKYPSLAIRRAIQYSKGALFLDALRKELGDQTFWAGIERYSRTNMGRTVSSSDLRDALERTSGRDLSRMFDQWVFEASAHGK